MNEAQQHRLSRRDFVGAALMALAGGCTTTRRDEEGLSFRSRPTCDKARGEAERGRPFRVKGNPLWGGGEVWVSPGDPRYDELWPERIGD